MPNVYSYDAAGNRLATGTGNALVEAESGSGMTFSGNWAIVNDASASGGSYRRAQAVGNFVDFSFSGRAVSFVYSTHTNGSTVRLTLDPGWGGGTVLAEINQCGPTSWQQVRTFTGLSNTSHVLRVELIERTCVDDNNVSNATADAFRTYTDGKVASYDDDNRLLQLTEGGTTTSFEYDRNGSTTRKTVGANVTTYAYDGARRLTNVALNSVSQASFTYDGNGARTSKTTSSGTTSYLNDTRSLTQVLQETKGGNTISYVPGILQHDPSQSPENAKWSYFHGDAQNNRALTDGGTTTSKRWEYDPFGVIRPGTSGSANSDFQYAGEQKDAETGLINLRARYYDPALGRFISRDPVSGRTGFPQSYNRFTYALNNPIRVVDPTGYGGWDKHESDSDFYDADCPGGDCGADEARQEKHDRRNRGETDAGRAPGQAEPAGEAATSPAPAAPAAPPAQPRTTGQQRGRAVSDNPTPSQTQETASTEVAEEASPSSAASEPDAGSSESVEEDLSASGAEAAAPAPDPVGAAPGQPAATAPAEAPPSPGTGVATAAGDAAKGAGAGLGWAVEKQNKPTSGGQARLGKPDRNYNYNWARSFHLDWNPSRGYHFNADIGPLKRFNHLPVPAIAYRLGSTAALRGIARTTVAIGIAADVHAVATAAPSARGVALGGVGGGWAGVAVGAAIGSAVAPGVGTVIGGAVGGGVGGVAGEFIAEMLR